MFIPGSEFDSMPEINTVHSRSDRMAIRLPSLWDVDAGPVIGWQDEIGCDESATFGPRTLKSSNSGFRI